MQKKPHLITVPKVNSKSGTLSFMEVDGTLPFEVKQLYWIYNIEGEANRGNHAHINTDRVIICISGIIYVAVEDLQGTLYEFELNDPSEVLFFPRLHWIKLKFQPGAVAAIGASDVFKNDVTVRDFEEFKKLIV
jgi:hypothetical protein